MPSAADHTSAAPTASRSASAAAAGAWGLALRAELGSIAGLVCPWLTGAVQVGSATGGAGASGSGVAGDAGAAGWNRIITVFVSETATVK